MNQKNKLTQHDIDYGPYNEKTKIIIHTTGGGGWGNKQDKEPCFPSKSKATWHWLESIPEGVITAIVVIGFVVGLWGWYLVWSLK